MQEKIAKSSKEMEKIAQDLVKRLEGGEVLALIGNLGAGKTVFVKGLAKAFGITESITSPTFVLMKIYQAQHPRIKRLVHIDCYRLEQFGDLAEIGLADYLHDPENIVVIEWADRVLNLPKNTININIEYINNQERRVKIS